MRIAFVGKGGSGKSTLTAAFVRHLASQGKPVLAIDGDVNQHLGRGLGIDTATLGTVPALGDRLLEIKNFFRGTNTRIPSAEDMIKTTPAGTGSRMIQLLGDDWFHQTFGLRHNSIGFMAAGAFTQDDLAVSCYHSKTGAIELYLNHLVDGAGEYVVVDMTAGADLFASPLFTKFDLIVVVCESTLESLDVWRQCNEYGAPYGLNLRAVGNKIEDEDDTEFLKEQIGEPLTWFPLSRHIKAVRRGVPFNLEALEAPNRTALGHIQQALDSVVRDWAAMQRLTHQLHLKNTSAWGGADKANQIDPHFDLAHTAHQLLG